jgi:CheY-like chemotaxis protein
MAEEKSLSILIVDDDAAIREIYESFFRDAGFTVYTAKDGEEGLVAAKQYHPSAVLLDLMMPKVDGHEMLKQLKSDASIKDIPVVIFSALITELEREESLAAGAAEYIEKSNIESPDQLLSKVKSVIGKE